MLLLFKKKKKCISSWISPPRNNSWNTRPSQGFLFGVGFIYLFCLFILFFKSFRLTISKYEVCAMHWTPRMELSHLSPPWVLKTQGCLNVCTDDDWREWYQVRSLDREEPLEKGMATHSSILAWRIPGTEEPGGLQSMVLQRDRHNWYWVKIRLNPADYHKPVEYPIPTRPQEFQTIWNVEQCEYPNN